MKIVAVAVVGLVSGCLGISNAQSTIESGEWWALILEGKTHFEAARYREAEQAFRSALDFASAENPVVPARVAVSLSNMALAARALGKPGEAETLLRRALVLVAGDPAYRPVYIPTLANLGGLYMAMGRYDEADTIMRRSLNECEHAYDPVDRRCLTMAQNLGALFVLEGLFRQAAATLSRVVAEEERVRPESTSLPLLLENLGQAYCEQGLFAEAESAARRALAIELRSNGPHHPSTAWAEAQLGVILARRGRFAEAIAMMEGAVRIAEAALPPGNEKLGTVLTQLATAYVSQGRYAAAEEPIRRAIDIAAHFGEERPAYIDRLEVYEQVLRGLRKKKEADRVKARLHRLEKSLHQPDVASMVVPAQALRREK